MILISCPNCGPRNQDEFRYGGEYNPRPSDPMSQDDVQWADYLYLKDNKLGVQKEWWYHRMGCQAWFLAERHTESNQFERTFRWEPAQ